MDLTTDEAAYWAELKKQLSQPPSEEDLAAWREFGRKADRLRVKVGRDFNIVDIVREMRGGWD